MVSKLFQNNLCYLILLLLPLEFLSIGDNLSVFRIFIFPLSALGLVSIKNKLSVKQKKFLIFLVFIQFFAFVTNLLFSYEIGFLSLINSIGIIIFISYLLSYINNFNFDLRHIQVISSYTVYCLVPLLLYYGFDNIEMFSKHGRFKGFHKDPNFFCAYINISIAAKFIYLFLTNGKYKFVFFTFLLIDIYSIFLTQSRGGIITLFLFILFFIFIYKKKLFKILLIFLIPLAILITKRIENISYNNINNLFDRILFRFSYKDYKNDDISDARLDHLYNFIDILNNSNQYIFGYSSKKYLQIFGQHPHNLFIDIILEYGFIVGIIFIFYILYLILNGFLNLQYKIQSFYYLLSVVAIVNMLPLSSLNQKYFWFIIVLLFISFNKKYAYK